MKTEPKRTPKLRTSYEVALESALDHCTEALQLVLDWDGGNAALLQQYAVTALEQAKKARNP